MADTTNPPKNGHQNCSLCSESLNCGNIAAARELIQIHMDHSDFSLGKHDYEVLSQLLQELGFNYPHGPQDGQTCFIQSIPKLSQQLVEESIRVLRSLESLAPKPQD